MTSIHTAGTRARRVAPQDGTPPTRGDRNSELLPQLHDIRAVVDCRTDFVGRSQLAVDLPLDMRVGSAPFVGFSGEIVDVFQRLVDRAVVDAERPQT
jgi:hypothetical protein